VTKCWRRLTYCGAARVTLGKAGGTRASAGPVVTIRKCLPHDALAEVIRGQVQIRQPTTPLQDSTIGTEQPVVPVLGPRHREGPNLAGGAPQ
jgi:hypothetical protein